MDALWSLEDKWKLSTQKAIALFACTSVLVIGLCVAVALKRRRKGSVHQEPCKETAAQTEPVVYPGWRSVIMKVLMGSARWSRGSKWEESLRGSWRETPRPLLVKRDVGGADGGRQSHNSTSAVWQRPILMGEKCELPRFSGLILYDQRGMPVHQCEDGIMHDQFTHTVGYLSIYSLRGHAID
ncbi:UNVERIFIED_CONTAM: hypothetical protein Sradi_6079700 [Sesamum radiatum]|uniref:Uncharacterized protein n=1 Tax=Sesamum radiatum TaxID=300843 RepID=A0AAW2KK10_SESRA